MKYPLYYKCPRTRKIIPSQDYVRPLRYIIGKRQIGTGQGGRVSVRIIEDRYKEGWQEV